MKALGKQTKTLRGFPIVEFKDQHDVNCSIQASSLAIYETPGTSAIWLGVNDPNPMIMAVNAEKLGIETDKDVGWIDFPIPEEVLLTTRMHLTVEQVEALIKHMQTWLDTGKFERDSNYVDGS